MFNAKQNKTDAKKSAPSTATPVAVAPVPEPEKPAKKEAGKPLNQISGGTVIEGNIKAEGDIELTGKVHGDVTTKAKLIVGESAIIEGNITAEHADIAGTVTGTVTVNGLLTIRQSSKIDGDVITKNLNVESGSMFTGRFHVGSAPKTNSAVSASKPAESPAASVLD